MVADPKILGVPPPDPSAGASAPSASAVVQQPPGASADPSPAPSAADVAKLQAELVRDRFDAAAARAGIDESYTDVALGLFQATGKEANRENLAAFCAELKKSKPALFGPQPANTAPVPAHAVPAAPAPGAISNPYQTWQALRSAGRAAEAEAFYLQNRRAIHRMQA